MPKKSMNSPAQRTIKSFACITQWKTLGFSTAKFYWLRKDFPIKKLRGACVQVVGPGTKEGKLMGNVFVINNTTLKVRLCRLKRSKKFEVGDTLVVQPKQLKELY